MTDSIRFEQSSNYIFTYMLVLRAHSHIDLTRRTLDMDERRYLVGRGVVTEIQSNLGEWECEGSV